jgi:hypothetical protein
MSVSKRKCKVNMYKWRNDLKQTRHENQCISRSPKGLNPAGKCIHDTFKLPSTSVTCMSKTRQRKLNKDNPQLPRLYRPCKLRHESIGINSLGIPKGIKGGEGKPENPRGLPNQTPTASCKQSGSRSHLHPSCSCNCVSSFIL